MFVSGTFRQASVSSLMFAFGRAAMRRWDQLVELCMEEYREEATHSNFPGADLQV